MRSGQDVSEFLDILGLVKSYFSSFFGEKKGFRCWRRGSRRERKRKRKVM
jgi:hypothetical protein